MTVSLTAKKIVKVNSIEEACAVVFERNMSVSTGASRYNGGCVRDDNGEQIGYVSWNGRYWEKGHKYYRAF